MRKIAMLLALLAALTGAAQAEPIGKTAAIVKAVRRPFQAAAGAFRLTKIWINRGTSLQRMKQQPSARSILFRTKGGFGLYEVAEELKARADLSGKKAIATFNGKELIVHPGTSVIQVGGEAALAAFGK